jgi:hypothetical protein
MEPGNKKHVVAEATEGGTATAERENVKVGDDILSFKQWSQTHIAEFQGACRRAFARYGPPEEEIKGETTLGDWIIPLVSGLAGALLGGVVAHASSIRRDRKQWTREDAAAMRRISLEIRHRTSAAAGLAPENPASWETMDLVNDSAVELLSFLEKEALAKDSAASNAKKELETLLDETEKRQQANLGSLKALGSKLSKDVRQNAANWATKINPKRLQFPWS